MKIPVVNRITFDSDGMPNIVGCLDVNDLAGQAIADAYRNGRIVSLDGLVCFCGSTVSMMQVAVRIENARAEIKPEPPKIALTMEPIGCEPRLKIGDVVKVDGFTGVVTSSRSCDGTVNQYEIVFPDSGLKRTGWKITEIDEVVSLGPFHSKES